jgi:uroporphyrinogen decarboxylase
MSANKREWVTRAFRNETVEKVPAGFWFHYTKDELVDGLKHPEMLEQNLAGHQKYYRELRPDFIKIMSDGFFIYPNREFQEAKTAADLKRVKSIGADHPWIEKQVALVKTLTELFGKDVLSFYNIFSPVTFFKFIRQTPGTPLSPEPEILFMDLAAEDPQALRHALDVVSGDLALLARRVIAEGGADGIYLSTQDIADPRFNAAFQRDLIKPGDVAVLSSASAAKPGSVINILHICGYEGHRNNLGHYVSYPADVFNWASVCENVSLGEGKKLFGGKPVLGGFANTTQDILYRGSKDEIQGETRRLLNEAGRQGVILGADCTIPRDTDLEHLNWVRETDG